MSRKSKKQREDLLDKQVDRDIPQGQEDLYPNLEVDGAGGESPPLQGRGEDGPGGETENKMELLQDQVKREQEKYFRALAEMENSRKRMQKEKQNITRFAVENTIHEFLAPLDNFENALNFAQQHSEDMQNWSKGFEMILTQFRDVLANHKIFPFHSEGCKFDPHMHEVIEIEETERHEEGVIIKEFVKGYKCGDKILRPARVKIAKAVMDRSEKTLLEEKNQGDS